jgi:hypothetical protein
MTVDFARPASQYGFGTSSFPFIIQIIYDFYHLSYTANEGPVRIYLSIPRNQTDISKTEL